ncbi:hypothetical protein MOMOMM089B2_18425 [Morganella morganii]
MISLSLNTALNIFKLKGIATIFLSGVHFLLKVDIIYNQKTFLG